jgi:bifunctional non-homologous end joining protein LigD
MSAMPLVLMLATLTDRRDFGEDWLLERKLDGEVVAFDGDQTSFTRLQQRLRVTNPSPERMAAYPVVFCVFDLLELDGDDLRDRPLLGRRARLTEAVGASAGLQLSEAWTGDSQRRFAQACRAGWEGLIAKRAQATLEYAGKVGTGYTAATLRDLGARLRELETPVSPFVDARPIPRGTHWTRPDLVAQIGFAEWTNDGRLRQPRFLGLRDDKRPGEAVREQPT